MCGRFSLTIDQEAIAVAFGVDRFLCEHEARYNIAPSQEALVLLDDESGRRIEAFRWGLVPSSAESARVGNRRINARCESVAFAKPYRDAWRHDRRCLVLTDGFYEWEKPVGSKGKIPHWIHMADCRPFGFAGLWERWHGAETPLVSFTILTTEANELVRPIHDRMPVILGDPEEWNSWVNPETPHNDLQELFEPFPSEEMVGPRVSGYVNRWENEGPECIAPLEP